MDEKGVFSHCIHSHDVCISVCNHLALDVLDMHYLSHQYGEAP